MSKFKISIKPIVLSVCTAFALFGISHISVHAQTKHSVQNSYVELERKLDQIAGKFYPSNQPGATVIVAKGGKVLLKKGYGLANVEKKEKMMPDHVLRLGSITKQFTAVAIMMLVEEGKVNLNDPVTKFIPDYPETGRRHPM